VQWGFFRPWPFPKWAAGPSSSAPSLAQIGFALSGHYLWYRKNLQTPCGLLIAIAVSMAPLAVYGVQDELGWWSASGNPGTVHDFYVWIKGSWIFMEMAAVIAGVVALRFYRFPFIVSIIAVALWFMSMDLTPWVFGTDRLDYEMRRQVSVWFGLFIVITVWTVDYRGRGGDFAFWLHLFGLMALWGGITAANSSSEAAKAVYCLFNAGLLLVAVVPVRRVYAVFGALGIAIYLGHLANVVLKDSLSLRVVADRDRDHRRRVTLSSQTANDRRVADGRSA
jgi:hypothetical protein